MTITANRTLILVDSATNAWTIIGSGMPGPPGPSGQRGFDGVLAHMGTSPFTTDGIYTIANNMPSINTLPSATGSQTTLLLAIAASSVNTVTIRPNTGETINNSVIPEVIDKPTTRLYIDAGVGNWVYNDSSTSTGARYEHIQALANTVWTVTHNLGYKPTVSTIDANDDVIFAEQHHVDINTLTVTFNAPTTGVALCN
jgi:hypothetical protein